LQQSIELAVPVAAEQLGADGGRKLVAYLGLDPNVRQSGEAPARTGRISKRGKCPGAPGARGSRLDRGATARAAQGVLSAHADPPRAWQGDRRDRAARVGLVADECFARSAIPERHDAYGDVSMTTVDDPRRLVHDESGHRGATGADG
jgi:hypothetical protein